MLYEAEAGDMRIAVAGDAMVSHRLSVYREPAYLKLVELLRGADAAFCNMEMQIHDNDLPPMLAEGTYGMAEPRAAHELRWMGINLVATANNHAFDFGPAGFLASHRKLEEAGIVHAGTGRNLSEARSAAYLDTPRGRVALLAAVSSFPEWAKAGDQRSDFPGRPGVNFLRFETRHTIDAEAFAGLQRVARELGLAAIQAGQVADGVRGMKQGAGDELVFQPNVKLINGEEFPPVKFVQGESFGSRTMVHKPDMEDILKWVRDARRQADWVVFSLHAHEGPLPRPGDTRVAGSTGLRDVPADFIVEFAHACIDAGADVFAGQGPHVLRGIEIYKGRPIFYSLAELIFQNETVKKFPADSYARYGLDARATPADFSDARTANGKRSFPAKPDHWESVVPICQFKGGRLDHIELWPIDLGFGKPRYQRGRPVLAAPELARRIIDNLQELSRPYGTVIEPDGERWIIRMPGAA